MLKFVVMRPAFVFLVVISVAPAQDLPDLKVAKVEIVPNSVLDLKDAFFGGRPIIEAAPVPEEGSEPLGLPMYRSYRFIVTVKYVGGKTPASCLVRTECVRDGKSVTLGKARIMYDPAPSAFVCYTVYSSQGGPGDCLIRTIVESEPGGKIGGILEFRARIDK
ncbi:MAG: hypothetical protein ACYC4U_08915 [Pirellulaceae bacterium]